MSRLITISLACLAIFTADALANAKGTAGATRWEVTSPFSSIPPAGFVPVTLTAINGGSKPTTGKYRFNSSIGYSNGNNATVASGTLQLPPNKAVTVTHWIWRGATYQDAYGQNFLRFNIETSAGDSSDTLDSGTREDGRVAMSRRLAASSGNLGSAEERVVTFDPKSLPADWRVFSSLKAVFMHSSDWDELSPGVRDAMRTWIGFGGSVRIADTDPAIANATAEQLAPSDSVLGMFAPKLAVAGIQQNLVSGQVDQLLAGADLVLAIGAPSEDTRRDNSYNRYNDYDEEKRRDQFPLRDKFGYRDIPYFFVCMLLIVFAVLVGPVALRLWAGPGKRHRLFFTTPVLSLGASGLMLVLMLFQDGIGIDGRRFVLLDLAPAGSSQPNAIVYQEQFSRAGMIGSRGFAIDEGLFPIVPAAALEEGLTVSDGRARGDWFSSRRDRSLVLAGSVPVRWGVTHEGATDKTVTLRLESPLTDLEEAWFVDADGLVWMLDKSRPGEDGRLTFIPAGRDYDLFLKPLFANSSRNLRDFVLKRALQKNQRNRFWALVEDGSAAAQQTDPKIDWRESNLVITSKLTPKS
ncbi:MAG: hypothetical protein ACI8XO_002102 [Verrucomicrobiales bacterium]|jgi:hypothetical protein